MSQHDDTARLGHMLEHARMAMRMATGYSRTDLDKNEMLQLALIRALEVVGEAAARVSPETCQAHPTIPWSHIVGMRHRLIHGYDRIDLDVLWNTVQIDLPLLVVQLQTAISP